MAVGGAPNTPPNGPPPSDFQSGPNLVAFDPKQAVPQQPVYLQRNDYLAFNLLANNNLTTLKIVYRWLTPEGEIKEGELDTLPFANTQFLSVPIFEGWLLSFGIRLPSGNAAGTWVFAQAMVVRTPTPNFSTFSYGLIWQGYVYTGANTGWPGQPSKEITDGPGVLRSVTITPAGAGVDISTQVPANRRWIPLCIRANLVTSATVANRFPVWEILDSVGNIVYQIGPNVAQAASGNINYNVAPGNQFYSDTQGNILIPFPTQLVLKHNYFIRTATNNLQAGDQWFACQALVLEWGSWDD